MSAFEELGVLPEIINALDELDWLLPTPPQTEAVPLILGGGDVAVAAETGSGKTGAFCLPIVQTVYETRATNLSRPLLRAHDTANVTANSAGGAVIALSPVDRAAGVAVAAAVAGTTTDSMPTTTPAAASVAQARFPPNLWQGVRATRPVARGSWYFTAVPRDAGLCRVGWSAASASLVLGTDPRSFGYGVTAMKSFRSRFEEYGETYAAGDEICCLVRFSADVAGKQKGLDECKVIVSFLKNEQYLGEAFEVPFAQLGEENLPLFPAVTLKNAEIAVDFAKRSPAADALGYRPIAEATVDDSQVPQALSDMLQGAEKAAAAAANASEGATKQGDKSKAPLALILEPSRELAHQVNDEIAKFSKYLPPSTVRQTLLVGGGNPKAEKVLLHSGRDIVAGTLGSVMMHVKRGALSLANIRFFVLDEADTFATENLPDVLSLHQKIPASNNVQTLLFSATLHSPEIKDLSAKIQSFPTWIDLKGKETVPDTVHHTLVRVDADADTSLLDSAPANLRWPLDSVHVPTKESLRQSAEEGSNMEDASDIRSHMVKKLKLLTLRKLIDAHDMSQAMLFVRTKLDGDNLESFLLQCSGVRASEIGTHRFKGRRSAGPELAYSCAVLHGGRPQRERNEALAAFKAGEVRFLICTDVAARGIDVLGLPYLVNVTLPDAPENYIHRVGRVGRAERLGLAVSIVAAQKEAVWFHNCGKPKNGVCNNRKLVTAGGCVMWLNESKMLAEIEERLRGRVEELGADYRRQNEDEGPRVYGAKADEQKVFEESNKWIEMLQPTVRELMRMEEEVQQGYFALQEQFGVR